jgi:transcription elongation factor GreA
MIKNKRYVSKEKFEELSAELERSKVTRRKEIAEQLEFAKSLGDLSENAEYHEAREAQAKLEDRIHEIEDILKYSEIVKEEKRAFIDVGSHVTIQDSSGNKHVWSIVGSEEANLAEHKLSHESPLGKSLIGKKVGEDVKCDTPKGAIHYTVNKIL